MIQLKNNDTILFIGDSITDIEFNKNQQEFLSGEDVYCLQVARELKKSIKG